MGFGILIMILIWSLVSDTPIILILASYINFESAKIIHALKVLIWGFGGSWRLLTLVWHLDHDFDMVIGLFYIHDPNYGLLS